MSHDHIAELFHLCSELVINVVAVPCFRLTKVSGESVKAFTQGFTFLMESSLRNEEVALGDVVVIIALLLKKRVRRTTWPIHHNQVG